jgi:hypothetical protein
MILSDVTTQSAWDILRIAGAMTIEVPATLQGEWGMQQTCFPRNIRIKYTTSVAKVQHQLTNRNLFLSDNIMVACEQLALIVWFSTRGLQGMLDVYGLSGSRSEAMTAMFTRLYGPRSMSDDTVI